MDGGADRETLPSKPPAPATITDVLVITNWKGDVRYRPEVVKAVETADEIVAIVKDQAYPSPVRVKGSHHSVTKCVVAEGGTVLDISGMNKILKIDRETMTITMQAGVQLKDAAETLERMGLQFHVNVELGNLTVGSGACCGTKKASYYLPGTQTPEAGQVSSYVDSLKVVLADGRKLVVKADDELIEAMRSSYGLLGVVYEVTYRIKELAPISFSHEVYSLAEFARKFEEIVFAGRSSMLYLFPFIDRVVVEHRWQSEPPITKCNGWWFRNFAWKTGVPLLGKIGSKLPGRALRSVYLNAVCWAVVLVLPHVNGSHSSPVDQIMRYSQRSGWAAYTFSLWAFQQRDYVEVLNAYFKFCKDYERETGYRCDMPSVGYAVAGDRSSLFSYTRDGHAVTIDPVSTGGPKWEAFLRAFNARCSQQRGKPLFNQTPELENKHVHAAFAPEIKIFCELRTKLDPHGRFYPQWFRDLLEG